MSEISTCSVSWEVSLNNEPSKLQSPRFYFTDRECHFECRYDLGYVNLFLSSNQSLPFDPTLTVSVEVDVGNNERVLSEMTQGMADWSPEDMNIIWSRNVSDVEAAVPLFRSERQLEFVVTFLQTDSVADDESSNDASLSAESVFSGDQNPDLCIESLTEDLMKLLDANSDPDVELHCEGRTTWAHRKILCARSPVLASMLQSDMVEDKPGVVNIRDMTNDTFQHFLHYLYTGKLDTLTLDAALRLYEAGDMYEVVPLASRCFGFLINSLTVENAYDALVLADARNDRPFADTVIHFMLEKRILMSGDSWRDFCESHSKLANKVYGRFYKMLCEKIEVSW